MVAFAVLRQATRVSPARLVAGMRVSLASSSVSKISKMSTNAMNVGVRAFSGSARRFGNSPADISLVQKLKEELLYEKESLPKANPEFLKTFHKDGVWTLHDTPGNIEVTLSRKFGDEDIKVMFVVDEIHVEEEDIDELESDSENDGEDTPAPYPIRASVIITKSTAPGALNIDMQCQEGQLGIEGVSFYDDSSLAGDLTAEADWKRRGLFVGPQFETLDIAVQEEFEKYLQERGINTLASFIPEYAAHKEQQEYVQWLGRINKFILL